MPMVLTGITVLPVVSHAPTVKRQIGVVGGYGAAIAVVLFLIMSVFITFFLWRIIKSEA